jgi:hypothetical protein
MRELIKKILEESFHEADFADREVSNQIRDFLETFHGEYDTTFTPRYFSDEMYDVKIIYKITGVNVWKSTIADFYEGTVHVEVDNINVKPVADDYDYHFEEMEIDDIPSWIWDDLQDKISDDVAKFFSTDVDVDFGFTR